MSVFAAGLEKCTSGPYIVCSMLTGTDGAGEVRCQSDKASPVFAFCSRNGNGLNLEDETEKEALEYSLLKNDNRQIS